MTHCGYSLYADTLLQTVHGKNNLYDIKLPKYTSLKLQYKQHGLFSVPVRLLWPFPLFCHPMSYEAPIATGSVWSSLLSHFCFSSSIPRLQDCCATFSMAGPIFLSLSLLECFREQLGHSSRTGGHLHELPLFLHVAYLECHNIS